MSDNLAIELTDNDVVRALECCAEHPNCKDCPYVSKTGCVNLLSKDVIDLINRQKAEIERLYEEANHYQKLWCEAEEDAQNAKTDAIKEFAKKLKDKVDEPGLIEGEVIDLIIDDIDDLVEEMTEANKYDNA